MRVSNTLLHSQVPTHGHNPEPKPIPIPPDATPVDIAALKREIAAIELEVQAMQEARGSLKSRLLASEQAVTACLREYSANPTDKALTAVDNAKKDEAQARLRVHTNNDSLAIRSKDLAVLQAQYDTALKGVVASRKARLIKQRLKLTAKHTKALNRAITSLLITEHLSGCPVGIINYKSFIQSRLPNLRDDVEKQVRTILENLKND